MTDYMDYLAAMRQGAMGAAEGPSCPACQIPLGEEHQIGPGDGAAVMANLGIMQVKLQCPGCNAAFDVSLPRGYPWKSSIDIPGWGRFPK
jgi:hypothetical protein